MGDSADVAASLLTSFAMPVWRCQFAFQILEFFINSPIESHN